MNIASHAMNLFGADSPAIAVGALVALAAGLSAAATAGAAWLAGEWARRGS